MRHPSRSLILCVISISMLVLTACFPKSELKETAIVQAIGIDLIEGGSIAVTLQTYQPKSAGVGASVSTADNNAGILLGEGETLSEAIHNASISAGKEVFTGYNRLLIVGKSFAEEGLEPLFSYFDRNIKTRQNVEVLVSATTAKEVVSADIQEGILAAETIEKMLKHRDENGMISYMPYFLLTKNMELYDGSAVIPMIRLLESETQGETEDPPIPSLQKVIATQSAVFADYQLQEILEPDETRGSVLLHNQLQQTTVVTENEHGDLATVHLYECEVTLTPAFEEGEPTLLIQVKASGTLDEQLSQGSEADEVLLQQWEEGCNRVLQAEMERSFDQMITTAGADILTLTERFTRTDPQRMASISEDWIHTIRPSFMVEVSIDRIGMQTDFS